MKVSQRPRNIMMLILRKYMLDYFSSFFSRYEHFSSLKPSVTKSYTSRQKYLLKNWEKIELLKTAFKYVIQQCLVPLFILLILVSIKNNVYISLVLYVGWHNSSMRGGSSLSIEFILFFVIDRFIENKKKKLKKKTPKTECAD